jgi:hypothetical protein
MDFRSNRKEQDQRLFIRFYFTVIQKSIFKLKNSLEKIITSEMEFKPTLWHNFACNFRDPGFCDLVIENNIWTLFIRIVTCINSILETVHEQGTWP